MLIDTMLLVKRMLLGFLLLFISNCFVCAQISIPGDNVMRYYRVALPISYTSNMEDFNGNAEEVNAFWHDVEDYLNKIYLPIGYCFQVVTDTRLIQTSPNIIDEDFMQAPSYGTELLDAVIGSSVYDIGVWMVHRPKGSENTGLALTGGAYNPRNKASAYAAADPWVVAHEMAHLFGATHTYDGSLMDTGGEFLSLTSISEIRTSCLAQNAPYYKDIDRTVLVGNDSGGNYVYGQKVNNNAPTFATSMFNNIRIPEGACFYFKVVANDIDNNTLNYATLSEDFVLVPPNVGNEMDFHPHYVADIYDNQYYYIVPGTDIPNMWAGTYSMLISVNDMPSVSVPDWDNLIAAPFYSNYATKEITVDIVSGNVFSVTLSPDKRDYTPGERVKISWGVNADYFTADSRLRISLSADYGKTFNYILAESVPALEGSCDVVMPDLKIENKDVDFSTGVRAMRGGIIRVEEIGGPAYNLSCLTPEYGGGFLLSGKELPSSINICTPYDAEAESISCCYDLTGRRRKVSKGGNVQQSSGIYISNGKKLVVR